MLNQQTMSILHSLKLYGMAKSFEERLADSNQAALPHDEFVVICPPRIGPTLMLD